jgi:hypothetical protein
VCPTAGDGAGTVCQVSRSDCEIILCQDPARRDNARLFIELTADELRDFRRELAERDRAGGLHSLMSRRCNYQLWLFSQRSRILSHHAKPG